MGAVIRATQDQFQWVMFYVGGFMMPEVVGNRRYTQVERARIQEKISALFDDLLPHSYYAQQFGEEFAAYFGDKEDWAMDPNKPGEYKPVKKGKEYAVEMSQKGISGLVWLFSVLLTPAEIIKAKTPMEKDGLSHPYSVAPMLASRFIWPMVKQIGKEVELRRAVGLDDQEFEPWTDRQPVAPVVEIQEVKGKSK